MYAKIAMLLLVAASAAACARNDQLACREFPTENSVKGPGCALIVAESEGQTPQDRPVPRDEPEDRPDDPRGDPDDTPSTEPGGPLGPVGQ
jgi:hypothetical protein